MANKAAFSLPLTFLESSTKVIFNLPFNSRQNAQKRFPKSFRGMRQASNHLFKPELSCKYDHFFD